uniref:Uncharacterized protein n=1 Tax=Glossina austeni TaxID=7395 RepID=A0A1A9UJT1_GLOAU
MNKSNSCMHIKSINNYWVIENVVTPFQSESKQSEALDVILTLIFSYVLGDLSVNLIFQSCLRTKNVLIKSPIPDYRKDKRIAVEQIYLAYLGHEHSGYGENCASFRL